MAVEAETKAVFETVEVAMGVDVAVVVDVILFLVGESSAVTSAVIERDCFGPIADPNAQVE